MDSRDVLKKTAAFASGGLLVVWIGGACGAVAFKALYWLFLGIWPDTALYGLAPAALIRESLLLPREAFLARALIFGLKTDILTVILLLPPLLLLPCLAILLAGRPSGVGWSLPGRPFSPAGKPASTHGVNPAFRRDRGLPGQKQGTASINPGTPPGGARGSAPGFSSRVSPTAAADRPGAG